MKITLLLIGLLTPFWASAKENENWWSIPYPTRFDVTSLTKAQEPIRVEGNQFVTPQGKTFVFKGVNIADPDKLARQNQWQESLFKEVKSWGANTVRLPIHPMGWEGHGAEQYFLWIDQAIDWANKNDLYLILDWHSIGNLQAGLFQHPMYDTSWQKTQRFWQKIAFRYQGVPTIAVYELFNEPTNKYLGNGENSLGVVQWSEWKTMMESLIDLIRGYDADVIPLVTGFNWAYSLEPIRTAPFNRKNIAYAVHPYPQKAKPSNPTRKEFFKLWEQHWGFIAAKAPIIATEIGWANKDEHGAHVPTINNDHTYGPNIVDFLAAKGASWTVWAFDPDWAPTMIKNWKFEPTEQGAFFKDVMQGKYTVNK